MFVKHSSRNGLDQQARREADKNSIDPKIDRRANVRFGCNYRKTTGGESIWVDWKLKQTEKEKERRLRKGIQLGRRLRSVSQREIMPRRLSATCGHLPARSAGTVPILRDPEGSATRSCFPVFWLNAKRDRPSSKEYKKMMLANRMTYRHYGVLRNRIFKCYLCDTLSKR